MTAAEQISECAEHGATLRDAEAVIGRALTEDEEMEFRKVATISRIRRIKAAQDAKRARAEETRREAGEIRADMRDGESDGTPAGPVSSTERSRAFRSKGREVGPIPPPRHRRLREACRYKLRLFGECFCMDSYEGMRPLLKRAPSPRMLRFIDALEDRILHGGLKHVRWPRGKGKSTWVKIAIIWAALYGHRFFLVVVEKTKGMSKVVVDEIWKRIYLSPRISADFPEFAIPMADVAMSPQRMRVQTVGGKPTYMKQDISQFHYYKLPTVAGYPNTGAIIAYRGSDQALRGINIESARPDFFFIDDPQTEDDARNPRTVAKIESEITGAVLGSGEIGERISAVMASTPIEPDDVSEVFASPDRHPEWETETERFVVSFGPKDLMSTFLKKLAIDKADAHAWYVRHRAEIEAGVEMMDDGDFDAETEVSAYEHALYQLYIMKAPSFYAEYQMTPTRSQGIYKLTTQIVCSRVNGVPMGIVPAECACGILSFVDVNAEAGLRWEIGAFGARRVVATLAYGQYPAEGQRLYPKGLPESAIPAYLGPAIMEVARAICSFELRDAEGKPLRCAGICFDGGWQTETVAAKVAELNASGIVAVWSKGFNCREYSQRHHEIAASGKVLVNEVDGRKTRLAAAENCHTWVTSNGVLLAYNSDYYKEVSQTSYLAGPLSPSSSSFYGDDPTLHIDFAQEVCNEELIAKDKSSRYGSVYTWRKPPAAMNHFGDVHAGLIAYGAIRRFFDPVQAIVSAETLQAVATARRRPRYVYEA